MGGGKWAADGLTRPDTLFSGGTGASVYYYRKLPGGVRVLFGGSGLHLVTLNGRDHRTDFGYSGSRLSSIMLPRGSAAPVQQYTFRYNASSGLLESVTAPAAGQPRVVQLTRSGDTLRITGPDTTGVRFVRHPTAPNRIHRRLDRMGAITEYGYGAGGLLSQVVRFGGGSVRDTADVVLSFAPAEIVGLAQPGTPAPYTVLDGPLDDAVTPDVALFWIGRWGTPWTIRDAMQTAAGVSNRNTHVVRDDPRFPGLVTRTITPNGRVATAEYDERGRVESTTDWSTQSADGRYATTLITWDDTWDQPTSITSPEGVVTRMEYSPQSGQRLWQQVGGDPGRRRRPATGKACSCPATRGTSSRPAWTRSARAWR